MISRPYYIIMIELGMEVMNLNGYLGVVAGSPRNGKWLVIDGNKVRRVREEHMREYDHEFARDVCGPWDHTPSSLEPQD